MKGVVVNRYFGLVWTCDKKFLLDRLTYYYNVAVGNVSGSQLLGFYTQGQSGLGSMQVKQSCIQATSAKLFCCLAGQKYYIIGNTSAVCTR